MNRNLVSLILVLFCFLNINANNTKPKLILVYSEHCSYSQDLINNTIANQSIQKILNENFEYKFLEENTEEAKLFIEKFKIKGFPTQIILKENDALFAYGVLSIESQTDFLNTTKDLERITASLYPTKKVELQEQMSAFAKHVFRETTLDFDTEKKKLLIPSPDEARRKCGFRVKPDRYACIGGGGIASHNFIDKGKKKGDFKVAIFHPKENTRNSLVSVTSFVEDGKVTQQSRCFSDDKGLGLGQGNKRHYEITRMECYVASAELCEVINEVETAEDLKDEKRFNRFLNVLKSPKYKKQLLDAYKYNWEKTFLNVNRDQHFDYYTTLNEKRFYNIETHGKGEKTKLINFEDSQVAKVSKSLYDIAARAKTLFGKVYLGPCKNLGLNNILAEPKAE